MDGVDGMEEGAEVLQELRTIDADLQSIHATLSGVASHGDMMIVTACLLLLVGVVIGVVAAACVGRWTR